MIDTPTTFEVEFDESLDLFDGLEETTDKTPLEGEVNK